ncbi:ribokinase [Thiothrix eikelboomii]|uniref:Ribokinase n=1 Tax=Thiothrix eikelboomii TaxID=92487 RepID=A0A1T4W5Y7_9GAMM|nr:PfkB family carbohydrate kinase [Thiothrix eikelboomii]SKA72607.1 ribokinase [Thiothrix eikelboomii]
MRVVVLGSYVQAHCLAVPALPVKGASIQAPSYWQEHGGKGLNLAVGMHRLGLSVCLLLAVGEDAAGRSVCEFLQTEGISTQHVVRLGAHSGFGIGLISVDEGNLIAVFSGANHLLNTSHLTALTEEIALAQVVCGQFEIQPSVVLAAFQLAKRYRVKTLLNPSPWQKPSAELLELTDILILNEVEARLMFELATPTPLTQQDWCTLNWSAYWSGELLIITLAERGAILFRQGQAPLYEPAWQILQADPTGAGDAFTAGWVYTLGQQTSDPQALGFANACGALLAQQVGVLAALPSLSSVEAFIRQNHSPLLR